MSDRLIPIKILGHWEDARLHAHGGDLFIDIPAELIRLVEADHSGEYSLKYGYQLMLEGWRLSSLLPEWRLGVDDQPEVRAALQQLLEEVERLGEWLDWYGRNSEQLACRLRETVRLLSETIVAARRLPATPGQLAEAAATSAEETVVRVTLSRRNLLTLLQKLNVPGSARTIVSIHAYRNSRLVDDLLLVLVGDQGEAEQQAEQQARELIHAVLCSRGKEAETYSIRWRRQSICAHCWRFLGGGRRPIRGPHPWAAETCAYCGLDHRSGISLRERDDRVVYPRQQPLERQ